MNKDATLRAWNHLVHFLYGDSGKAGRLFHPGQAQDRISELLKAVEVTAGVVIDPASRSTTHFGALAPLFTLQIGVWLITHAIEIEELLDLLSRFLQLGVSSTRHL